MYGLLIQIHFSYRIEKYDSWDYLGLKIPVALLTYVVHSLLHILVHIMRDETRVFGQSSIN